MLSNAFENASKTPMRRADEERVFCAGGAKAADGVLLSIMHAKTNTIAIDGSSRWAFIINLACCVIFITIINEVDCHDVQRTMTMHGMTDRHGRIKVCIRWSKLLTLRRALLELLGVWAKKIKKSYSEFPSRPLVRSPPVHARMHDKIEPLGGSKLVNLVKKIHSRKEHDWSFVSIPVLKLLPG